MKHRKIPTVNQLIGKLKSGYEFLSQIQRLPPSRYNFVATILGVGVGVAGLFMALQNCKNSHFGIPWVSQRKDSSERIFYVGGLQNLGNNCFLNVILQALASCSSFLPFLQNVLETDELNEEEVERMPLIVALCSLLEADSHPTKTLTVYSAELCIIHDERTVLNPRRVMCALSLYTNNFNLTRQQDASEAFIHLLSSLKNESSHNYVPHGSSLANITSSSSRIYNRKAGDQHEFQRWRQILFGPFDGTIGSILTCRSCSSLLSVYFESFHCLPLSPVLDRSENIIDGCTLTDCLKHFTAVEHLESYHCSRCWHIAVIKHLSLKSEKDEEKINKLSSCVNHDSCSCRDLFHKEEITWSGFSHASKQLIITCYPQILCIYIQRASMNISGEFVKRQGHISFPLFLDLLPFMAVASTLVQETSMENMKNSGRGDSKNLPFNKENAIETGDAVTSKSSMYRLSSVVEHYGRYGGGHYAAYRRAMSDSLAEPIEGNCLWFYTSDREVSQVSEETVLAAEATLLFYERI
ncbi:Ubiquitin carboxyl-terminal hydrolase 27 [Ananas comosus]|uniref:Ubiquitin carboxyl-terminal hydrolase n=1 Tax=Ananas comosus TaxID=4615 RepID=A0A199URU9_ANACO|nr:Ubiquitin carboxyl-terminal hydrolase 27 [Ananas comosus]